MSRIGTSRSLVALPYPFRYDCIEPHTGRGVRTRQSGPINRLRGGEGFAQCRDGGGIQPGRFEFFIGGRRDPRKAAELFQEAYADRGIYLVFLEGVLVYHEAMSPEKVHAVGKTWKFESQFKTRLESSSGLK